MSVLNVGAAWSRLPPGAQRSLELAHLALGAGGLAVGSTLVDPAGRVVAEGRNRAYDPPEGDDPLQGTPLAHAELNVLASVPTGRDLGPDTLWSTQQPCTMCDAAVVFTGVGCVRWLAPDPWARAAGVTESRADEGPHRVPPTEHTWLIVASTLFLASIARTRGVDHPTVARNRDLEPETDTVLRAVLADGTIPPLPEMLASHWPAVRAAAQARSSRVGD